MEHESVIYFNIQSILLFVISLFIIQAKFDIFLFHCVQVLLPGTKKSSFPGTEITPIFISVIACPLRDTSTSKDKAQVHYKGVLKSSSVQVLPNNHEHGLLYQLPYQTCTNRKIRNPDVERRRRRYKRYERYGKIQLDPEDPIGSRKIQKDIERY